MGHGRNKESRSIHRKFEKKAAGPARNIPD
jgi:hypothetical protein